MKQLKPKQSIIKGYTFEEIAAKQQEELDKQAEAIKDKANKLFNRKQKLLEEINHIDNVEYKDLQIEQMKYRINSVNRVLDYLKSRASLLTPRDIGTYLTHCQNRLNGNIDGGEVTLDFTSREAQNDES